MADPKYNVRRARVEDAARIVRLVSDGLDPSIRRYTIFDQVGCERFIEDQLRESTAWTGTHRWVVDGGDELIGVAEILRTPSSLFLNHIYVDRRWRGVGWGTKLLDVALSEEGDSTDKLGLDVALNNDAASRWYRSLGLKRQGEVYWHLLHPDTLRSMCVGRPESAFTNDFSTAAQQMQRYGFGKFHIQTPIATYSVGILGNAIFRLADDRALSDPALLNCLGRIDSTRHALLISGERVETEDVETVAEFTRMLGTTSTIQRQLRDQT